MALESSLPQQMNFDQIRYSMVWEDSENLLKILTPTSQHQVLCIGSAGCNVISLALTGPKRIVAIDLSPAQIALIRLKVVAIETLSHADFVSLIGLKAQATTGERTAIYQKIRPHLDSNTRAFWDSNSATIESGISCSGRLDRYLKKFREERLGRYWTESTISNLLACATPEAQVSVLKRTDLDGLKREIFEFFGREAIERFARDPAQFKYVEATDIEAELWARFMRVFERRLLSENYFLRYFLTGQYPIAQGLGSPYLRPENFEKLKSIVGKIEIVHQDLEKFLSHEAPETFDLVALSDVFEYMSVDHANEVFSMIARSLKNGGKLGYWNLFVDRTPDAKKNAELRLLDRVSKGLSDADRLWFYQDFRAYEKLGSRSH